MALHLIGKPRVLETDTRTHPRRYLPYLAPPPRRNGWLSIIGLIRLIGERFVSSNYQSGIHRATKSRLFRARYRGGLAGSRDEPFCAKGMETSPLRTRPLNYYNSRPVCGTRTHMAGDILFLLGRRSLRPRRYFALSFPRKYSRTHPLSTLLAYGGYRVISQEGYVRAWWCIISTIFSGESSYEGPFRNTEWIMSEVCKSLSKNLHVKSIYARTQKIIRRCCLFNLLYHTSADQTLIIRCVNPEHDSR